MSDDLNISAAQEFANKISDATETLKNVIDISVRGVQNLTDFVLGPLKTTVDALNSAVDAIQDGINDTLNIIPLDILALAGQIQNLIELPLLGSNSLSSRLNAYDDLSAGFSELLPGGTNNPLPGTASPEEEKNSTAVQELAMTAAIVSYGKIASTSSNSSAAGIDVGLETRAQAIAAAEQLVDSFNFVVEKLEEIQLLFRDYDLDVQYFSQTQSYTDAVSLINNAINLLLSTSFDLKIEKRFVLKKPRTPIEITITEYGELGEDDSNLDLFIKSNNLKNNDILLLPAGREVVIYA